MLMLKARNIRLRFLFLASFGLVALLPVAFLAIWVISRTAQHEVDNSASKQVSLATTFAMALDRYAVDRMLIFDQCAKAFVNSFSNPAAFELAAKSDFQYFAVIPPNAAAQTFSTTRQSITIPADNVDYLRQNAKPYATILPLVPGLEKQPTLFIARMDQDGTIIAGALGTSAIRQMQTAVSFGVHGHAVVVDQAGTVIGHPKTEWESSLKSLADLEPVKRSIAGELGYLIFTAPAHDEDAMAGFTRTRNAGWGVLMVRPMAEINDLAWANTRVAIDVIIAGVVVALIIAWLMSRVIVRPVERAAATARNLSQSDFSARFEPVPQVPTEFNELGTTLNLLAERIDTWRQTAVETLSTVKASDQAKSEFMATLSHEVRTPLNAIIGFGELMQMDTGRPDQIEKHREYAANILTAGRHLMKLIDEILDLAVIESGHTQMETEAINLAKVISETRTLLEPAAVAQQVTVNVELPPETPAVMGDPLKLKQILLNLIGNAIKFTPKGGSISVKASKCTRGLRVSIADTGIGMTEEEIQTALTPFGRVRNKRASGQQGAGLGLPLARRLIETMNGHFELQSEPKKGTEVSITLPVA